MQKIRAAKESEHTVLGKIWEDSVRATHFFLLGEDFDYFKALMPKYFTAVELYVYEEGDEILGFLGVSDDSLEMLFVRDRGRGVGTKLTTFAIKELGVERVDVNQQNSAAHQFYLKHGFEEESISERDGSGKPYPTIHMVLKD